MKSYLLAIIGPTVFIFLWWIVFSMELFNPVLLPSPFSTIYSFMEMIKDGGILKDLGLTLYRTTISFLYASLVGVPLGLLLGSSKKLYKSLEFLIDFFRSMPATAVFPVFLLFFGITDASKIAVAVFAAGLIIIFNTAYGVMNASKSRILFSKVLGAGWFKQFKSILFWESLPQTFVGLRVALNLSLIIIVVTEMFIGTNAGLGRRIIDFQIVYKTEAMYAVIILTGIVGYILNILLNTLQTRLIHWVK